VIDVLHRILRAPANIAEDCRAERDLSMLACTAIVTIVLSAAMFGATIGSWRGGYQIAFAALKMPFVLLGTLALAAPAFYGLAAIFGRPWSLRSILSLSLASGARFSLVLLALTPPLWLTIDFGASYHAVKLCATAAYALAGLGGLSVFVRGLGHGEGKRPLIGLVVGIFLLIGAQDAWVLRPYLVKPDANEITFFTREREGGLVVQLLKSLRGLGSKERRGSP
jgi:hypothetical protein